MQFDEGEQSAYTGSVLLKYSSIFFHLCLVHLSPWYVGWLGIQNCLLTYLRSQSGLTMPLSRQCGNLSGNELTRNLSGNIQPQSSQLAEPLWTDPSIKRGSCVYQLISTSKTKKEKKKVQAENGWSNIFPKSSQVRKKPPPVPPVCVLTCTRNCCVWTLTKCMVGYSLLSSIPWSVGFYFILFCGRTQFVCHNEVSMTKVVMAARCKYTPLWYFTLSHLALIGKETRTLHGKICWRTKMAVLVSDPVSVFQSESM